MSDNPNLPENIVDNIQEALDEERFEDATSTLIDLHPADQAEIFNTLEDPLIISSHVNIGNIEAVCRATAYMLYHGFPGYHGEGLAREAGRTIS